MMSSFAKYITTIGVISWLLMHNINSAGSAEIPPSDCILLIGGKGHGKPIEYYNPDDGVESDRKHLPALNFSAQQIPFLTSGCYFADTQQIVVREDRHRPNASIYDLQDGSITDIPAAHSSLVAGTTSASFGPSRCLSCGGYDYSKEIRVNDCYEFDMTANKWTNIRPLPNATNGAASVSLGHFYYVIGGYDKSYSDKVYRYDTTQTKWTTIQSMNSKRYGHSAMQLSDKEIIACGGSDHSTYVASCEVYSNVTQKWRKVASMNTPRSAFALVGFNGQIYAIGGDGDPPPAMTTTLTTTTVPQTTTTQKPPSATKHRQSTPHTTKSTRPNDPMTATEGGIAKALLITTEATVTSSNISPGMITIICLAGVTVVIVPLTVVLACLYCRKRRAKRSRVTAKKKREESEMESSMSEPTPKKRRSSEYKAEEPRLKNYDDGTETETTDEPSDYNELDTVTSHRIDVSLPTDGEY